MNSASSRSSLSLSPSSIWFPLPLTPIMAAHLLRHSFSQPGTCFSYRRNCEVRGVDLISRLPVERHRCFRRRSLLRPHAGSKFVVLSSLETRIECETAFQEQEKCKDSSVLLDVSGMMCGGCVSRVKNILSADERVDSVVVNMLTETAAVKLKKLDVVPASVLETEDPVILAEALAGRLTECGFPTKRRVSGTGMAENVRKWRDLAKKKEELLAKSRNRVAFAWTLVALCCGSHASHILHSLGIHIAHGIINSLEDNLVTLSVDLEDHFGSKLILLTENKVLLLHKVLQTAHSKSSPIMNSISPSSHFIFGLGSSKGTSHSQQQYFSNIFLGHYDIIAMFLIF